MEWKKVYLLWIVVSIVQIVGFLLTIIGYASKYIVSLTQDRELIHTGIWTGCVTLKDICVGLNLADLVERSGRSRAWVDASRGLMSISFVGQFLVVLLTSLALCRTPTKLMCWVTSGVGVFSGIELTLIGYSTNYILSMKVYRHLAHIGMWSECRAIFRSELECENLDDLLEERHVSRDWLDVSRALMTISFVCQLLTLSLTTIAYCRSQTSFMCCLTTITAGISVLTGIIGISVAAVNGLRFLESTDLYEGLEFSVDWSFASFIIGQYAYFVILLGHCLIIIC
ncbi:uncharacterized protein LOC106076733 [Biomphalaria glabrata]|uniref:Uncharacterized protein LOC106076733 n=1 Tax=Biomphalaria glabrata TaxID=6526 RepID=A0A9W2ZBX9_BIOGL|nr:uncharacterized protein LOC106076733 [Biomphalaria glabrata]